MPGYRCCSSHCCVADRLCVCSPTSAAAAAVPLPLYRDDVACVIYRRVLVCVLMSLNFSVRIIDQSCPTNPSPPIRPLPPVGKLHLFHIHPCVLSFSSISSFYVPLCVIIPLPPSLCVLYSSLLSFALSSPLSLPEY